MFFRLPEIVNDSRIELPSSEDNLPELLIQVPDFSELGYRRSSRAEPPQLPNQPSAKRGESVHEGERGKKWKFSLSNHWGRWINRGKHAAVFGILGLLLIVAFALITGNDRPKRNRTEPEQDSVQIPRPKVELEVGNVEENGVLHLSGNSSEQSRDRDQNNSLADKYLPRESAGAKLLAPKLDGRVVFHDYDNRVVTRPSIQEGVVRRSESQQARPRVDFPLDKNHSLVTKKDPAPAQQPEDWRYSNYQETNPRTYEYPSHATPELRISRQQNEPRGRPQTRRDGTWQGPRLDSARPYRGFP
ncbi:MAG: hypothetical protein IH991_13050 [Planctomycetes bacterium]|nr:hypothetical protein [Planctomycetota bacterium]